MHSVTRKSRAPWTRERAELVVRLFLIENLSTAMIAAELKISRSAVTGKLARLGIKRSDHLRRRIDRVRQARRATKAFMKTEGAPHSTLRPVLTAIGRNLSVADLEEDSCRWMEGDRTYCGLTKVRGSFCATHAAIACKPKR